MKTKKPFIVRPSHFAGKWILESPWGVSMQFDTKEAAVKFALKRSEKVIYSLPKQ